MAKAKKAATASKAVSSKKATPKKAAPAKSIKLGGVPNQGNKRGR